MRKSQDLTEKMKIIQTMANRMEQGITLMTSDLTQKITQTFQNHVATTSSSSSSTLSPTSSPTADWQQQQTHDLKILNQAIEAVLLEAERLKLDRKIMEE